MIRKIAKQTPANDNFKLVHNPQMITNPKSLIYLMEKDKLSTAQLCVVRVTFGNITETIEKAEAENK